MGRVNPNSHRNRPVQSKSRDHNLNWSYPTSHPRQAALQRRLLPPPRLRARPHPAENRLPPGSGRKGPLYLRAEAEENRIAIKFDGWLPAEKPTDAFTKKWKGLINTASGNVTRLFPRDTGSIPGADGDLPRDGRNTPQFAHHVAARVAAAAAAAALQTVYGKRP